ncbi:PLP-dependent aminotransferase family protein [Rhodanobacter sp. FDAARGOS 1247]|uniref:MocR-like pyridoxine biosynthesis transcription factor PdxR n=1 Tax=Rhodanobacter sp. FDAARGOS 1247 TaxID=2778082 RepID=UPI0019525459|nr:PLP-dependent aminotransferase family protein [Rhodanobacter sp. FDAARGOS 1247]QRP65198.1 PLP-dependent aminotransferase family protein [Rhodanobacter sp. FDAARGOS 1247]
MEPVFPFPVLLPRGAGSLTQALHQQLRAAILDGRLPPHAALPATRKVAEALGVARNTVVAAYDLLIAEGYVVPRQGARPQVAEFARRRSRPARAGVDESRLAPAWRTPFLQPSPARSLPERNFRLGIPDHRHFPHEVWRRLMAQTLRRSAREPFAYAPSQGIPALREAIAQHVAFARAVACSADDVIVTSGAQQAFDLIARLLVTPGQTKVAVEEPGYPPVRAAFAAAGAQLVPLPVDDEGLCVERLPEDVRIISVTPSHQSPTGVAMSLRRRAALLDFARRHHAVIVEDDYDGEFRFGGRPLDALQTLDRDALVFYVGTFSKSMFPSLRKGFVVAPAWARSGLVTVKHCVDSHCDGITQAALAAFIRDGHLARHVRHMRPIYAARREALLDGLQRGLGEWLQPIPSEAGLHLAARLRDSARASKLMPVVLRAAAGAEATADYAMTRDVEPAVTFGYGVIDAADISAALAGLRRSLRKL